MIHLESLFKCPVGSFHRLRTLGLYAVCSFHFMFKLLFTCCTTAAAAAAKSLQSCPTLCDPMDGSLSGSTVPEILQARTLEWDH